MRLIDADALKEIIEDHVTTVSVCPTVEWARGKTQMKLIALEDIDNAPTIEAEPEGIPPKMEKIEWDTQFVIASCGQCGKRLLGRSEDITNYFRYCPTCGRKVKWDETD